MSREIKFRFWDINNKKWADGMGIYNDGIIGDFSECFHNIAGNNGEFYIAQQFTGLLDKNGCEIWEGDICDAGIVIGVVDYSIGGFSLASNQLIEYLPADTENYDVLDVKVVGNILENPDFFK